MTETDCACADSGPVQFVADSQPCCYPNRPVKTSLNQFSMVFKNIV